MPDRRGEYWMATVDSWEHDGFAPVRQLKIWRKKVDGARCVHGRFEHSEADLC